MASSVHGCEDDMLRVRVLSRRLVKASDTSIAPHVLAVSNLDLLPETIQVAMLCIYPAPPAGAGAGGFAAVVAAFEAGLPSLLNHFFPLAGRIAADPSSGLPEVRCSNQGAELVVGEAAAGAALAALDSPVGVGRIQLPYAADVALSVQLVSFACGGFTVSWSTNHALVDGCALSALVSAWSEIAASGALSPGSRPTHDRAAAFLRPRAPPSYAAALDAAFTPATSPPSWSGRSAWRTWSGRRCRRWGPWCGRRSRRRRTARLCSGFMQIAPRPGGDGSWIATAYLWPRLAAALESDEPRVFRPLTAEYLGLSAPHARRHSRL